VLLWVLQGLQIFFMGATCYRIACTPPTSQPARLSWVEKSWTVFTMVISALIQLFYIRRIWRLCKCWPVTATLYILLLVKIGSGIALLIGLEEKVDTVFAQEDIQWVIVLHLGSEAVIDQIIAWSMAYALFLRRTDFQSTNTVIDLLVRYAVGTGFVTSVLTLVALISYMVSVQSFVLRFIVSIEAFVYYCAMLANLHIRSTLKKYLDHTQEDPIHLTTLEPHAPRIGDRIASDSWSAREGGESQDSAVSDDHA